MAKDKNDEPWAVIFGHYEYKLTLERLGEEAVSINKEIEQKHNMPAKNWAMANKSSKLSRNRYRV